MEDQNSISSIYNSMSLPKANEEHQEHHFQTDELTRLTDVANTEPNIPVTDSNQQLQTQLSLSKKPPKSGDSSLDSSNCESSHTLSKQDKLEVEEYFMRIRN